MATVGAFGIELSLNYAGWKEGLHRAEQSATKFQRGVKTAMNGVGVAIGAAVVAAGALATATKTAIDFASSINDASKAAGVSAETFQELSYQAQLVGVSAEEFGAAMVRANKAVGEAAKGTGGAAKVFEELGISVRDAKGEVLPVERVIAQLSDKMALMETSAERSAAAAALFGRSAGPKLVAMLEQGSSAMEEASQKAREMGAVISNDLIAQADEAGDKLDTLSTIVKAQLTSGLISLTPVITAVGQAFADAAPHVNRFFNYLFDTGSQADKIAGKMGEIEEQITRTGRAAEALRRGGQFEAANDKIEEQIRLMKDLAAAREQYNELLRGDRPTPASPVALGDPVNLDSGKDNKAAKAEQYVETAQDRANQRWGRFLDSAAEDHQDLLTEFAEQRAKAADELERGLQSNTEVMLDWYAELEARHEQAASNIADGLTSIVFAGFSDGFKGMRQEFNDFLQGMILDLARSKIKEMLFETFQVADGGGISGGKYGGFFNAVISAFGGSSGASLSKAGASGSFGGLKGFASGGSFTVPGPSSGDKVIPLFRANGGETVSITPKGGSQGLTIVNNNDFRGADPGSEARLLAAQKQNNEILKRQIGDLLRRNRL